MSIRLVKQIEKDKELSDYTGDDEVISSGVMLDLVKKKDVELTTLKSSFPSLDRYIDGFEEGELTAISGLTGNGKTLFALTLTERFACGQASSLWFSYELTTRQFLKQFGDRVPLFYLPKKLKSNRLEWLRERIWEAKVKYAVNAVFIDHLHYLVDMKYQNMSLEIGNIMRHLKRFALEFYVSVFIIAHTVKAKSDRELGLGDIRDSSFIEQEVDNVFYLWRSAKDENQSVLKIAKNRRNGVMNKKIRLVKVGNYLEEFTNG